MHLFQILIPFSPRVNANFLHSYTTVILQTTPLDYLWNNVRVELYKEWVIPLSWLNFGLEMLFSCEAIGGNYCSLHKSFRSQVQKFILLS